MVFTSNGASALQPPGEGEVLRNTEPHGWCNIPIFAPASYPPAPGPWSATKLSDLGAADIVTGMGLPFNWHVSTFIVYQATRWADLVPGDPDPDPGDPLILATLARIEARLNALAAHLGA